MKRLLYIIILLLVFSGTVQAETVPVYSSCRIQCDEDPAFGVTSCDGELYAVFESGLYRIIPSGEKECIVTASELPAGIDRILADNHSVYAIAYADEQANLIQLTNSDGTYLNQIMLTLDDMPYGSMEQSILKNGFLYYVVGRESIDEVNVARVSVTEGSSCTVQIRDLVCFDVMDDGMILALTNESNWPDNTVLLQIVSPDNGKAELWTTIEDNRNWFDLLYDGFTDTVCLIEQRMAYKINKEGIITPVEDYSSQDINNACLLPNGLVLVRSTILSICSFENDQDNQRIALKIFGPYADDEWFTSFYKNHPEISIVPMESLMAVPETPEERFYRDMVTQNPDVDIYILHNLNLISTIKEKKFYADLSISEEAQEKISRMYDPFVQAFTDNGKIVAFPHPWYVFFSTISYNKEIFSQLGISVPDTWDEYFQFCIDWKMNYEDDYPDYILNPFEHDLSMVFLLACYDDEMKRAGINVDYTSAELCSVMEKYLQVKELYDHVEDEGTPVFYDYSLQTASNDTWGYQKLSLTFLKESDPIYTPMEEDIYYFVVNPFGSHVSQAVECVATAKDENRANEPNIYQKIPDLPLENKYYGETIQKYKDTLAILEARKEKSKDDPESMLDINQEIDKTTEEMQDYTENHRWWLTEEKMAFIRELNQNIYFSDFNPIRELYADEPDFFEGVTKESVSSFLSSLDNRIRMIYMERGR